MGGELGDSYVGDVGFENWCRRVSSQGLIENIARLGMERADGELNNLARVEKAGRQAAEWTYGTHQHPSC